MTRLLKILRWSLAGFIALFSLALLSSGDIISAIFMTGAAFLVSPLATSNFYSKLKWRVPTWGKIALVILLFSVSASFASPLEPKQEATAEEIQAELEVEPENTPSPAVECFVVTKVTDGDTIKVLVGDKTETIRIANIDTPETVDPRKSVECMGQEASAKMNELVSGKQVSLMSDSTQADQDRYDRLLRFVFLEDGTDVGLEMIRLGYAKSSPYGSLPHEYLEQYAAAQKEAQEKQLGLWNPEICPAPTPTPSSTPKSTTQPIIQNSGSGGGATGTTTSTTQPPSSVVVKKSTNDICHAPGTTYYDKTTNYTAYNSIDECLARGGRLPKR